MARPGVTAPIASATSREQLASLAKAATLHLGAEDMAVLDKASAVSGQVVRRSGAVSDDSPVHRHEAQR